MALMESPDDPLFFLHHANIDRVWAIFQDYHNHDQVTTHALGFTHLGSVSNLPYWGSNYDAFFQLPWTFQFPTAVDLHHLSNAVDVRYVQDGLAYSLSRIAGSRYTFSNNNAWVEIGTGPVTTNNANCATGTSGSGGGGGSTPGINICRSHDAPCSSNDDCCSGYCNPWGASWGSTCYGNGPSLMSTTDAPTPSPMIEEEVCLADYEPCTGNDDCCSGLCYNFQWWGPLCYGSRRNLRQRGEASPDKETVISTTRTITTNIGETIMQTRGNGDDDKPIFHAEELNKHWKSLMLMAMANEELHAIPGVEVDELELRQKLIQKLRNDSCTIRHAPNVLAPSSWIHMENMDNDAIDFECRRE